MSTITEGYLDAPVFKLVSDVAADLGVRAFVIGGYVRDCFLGRPNTDIDNVVEGSGIALAEAVAAKVPTNVSVFKNFGTAMLHYKGIEFEFVGARKDFRTGRGVSEKAHRPGVGIGAVARRFNLHHRANPVQRDAVRRPVSAVRDKTHGFRRAAA